jgi:hypothetical protein
MSREVKRVPLDFDLPLNKVWPGFLMPDRLTGSPCIPCDGSGYSMYARQLYDEWYGIGDSHFIPKQPLAVDTPEVRAFAERNCKHDPDFYGISEAAIVREARRLIGYWNTQWSHHLDPVDVDALIAADQLWDLTKTWTEADGWKERDPMPTITAAQVNTWSIPGIGHDSINCSVVIRAKCVRDGHPEMCELCEGHGFTEVYPGQRADSEAWESEEPPIGEGYQLWESVSEGSPISPVFPDAEGLAQWMASPAYHWGASSPLSIEQARRFVGIGWAPTGILTSETGFMSGEAFI